MTSPLHRVFARLWVGSRRVATLALDLLLPPRCLLCSEIVDRAGSLCAACWKPITFFAEPCCARCGLPFPYAMPPGTECGPCLANPPPYDRARSVMRYDDHSRGLLLALKHADRLQGVPSFGAWLARIGGPGLTAADIIVPVPLHWTRLWHRRYNQSALLAYALAKALATPSIAVIPDLLIRKRSTPPQGRLTRLQRQKNIRAAFAVRSGHSVKGKHILLIDDVMTSGATLDECARVLRRAGAKHIEVLTLARAVRID